MMAEYIEREATCKGCVRYGMGETLCADCVVKNAPTADVAPVVHGRWIEKEELYFDVMYDCSACGESFCFIEGNPSNNLYNYCPNCGAHMKDGETQ